MKSKSILTGFIILSACSSSVDRKIDTQISDLKDKDTSELCATKSQRTMNSEIKRTMSRLEEGMIDYMTSSQTAYNKEDVDKCIQIITSYLDAMAKSKTKEEGLEVVKNAVLALNELNETCEYELIATDQREDICEMIIMASSDKEYNEMNQDVTEEWREW